KLIESIRNSTVVTDKAALTAFAIRPMGMREAIERAIRMEDKEFAVSHWSDAFSSGASPQAWGGTKFGSRLVDSRTAFVPVARSAAFIPIRRIGGGSGWYYANVLWGLRGL